MSANLIANRYAKSLLKVAGGNDSLLTKMSAFLSEASGLFENPDIKSVLRSPVVSKDIKRDVLTYVSKELGAGSEVEQFVVQLVEAGRVQLLPEIKDTFQNYLQELKGEAIAVVTVANELSGDAKSDMAAKLSKVFQKRLVVTTKVDASILGGFIAKVGNKALDLSVKSRLDSLAVSAEQ